MSQDSEDSRDRTVRIVEKIVASPETERADRLVEQRVPQTIQRQTPLYSQKHRGHKEGHLGARVLEIHKP